MLRGNYAATVDEKGRLKIPADFMESLREYGTKFYVTSENGDHALIYPMSVWNGIEEKLSKLSSHNRTKQRYLTRTNYFGRVVDLDPQGRLLLPPILRETAQMKGEVDVLGQLTCLEVWNHARFLKNLENNPITDEDHKTLDELGI